MKTPLLPAIILAAALFVSACGTTQNQQADHPPTTAPAQTAAEVNTTRYEVLDDHGHKMLKGRITPDLIKKDTAFKWYNETLQYYRPNAELVQQFRDKAGRFNLVLFIGTWCVDSQAIIPGYISSAEEAGLPHSIFTVYATDRAKTTLENKEKDYKVTLIPTIIVMQNGQEVGRVEEYGETGLPDNALLEVMKKVQ